MRKAVIILLLFPFVLHAQNKKAFLITGKLKSIPDSTRVILLGFNGTDTIAETNVRKGEFTLQGSVDNTDARIILFPALQRRMVLFMGNDTVNITGNSEFSDIVVTGSPSNLDYEEFIYDLKPINDYVDFYRNQMMSATTQGSHDSAVIMLNTAYNIYQNAIDRFIARKKSSPVTALLLAWRGVDDSALEQICRRVYDELGKIARRCMRGSRKRERRFCRGMRNSWRPRAVRRVSRW